MAGKEVKWGIFVTSGIIVLFAIFLLFGEFKFFSKGYHIFVRFNFTNGLEKNAPVRLAGVNIGNVEDVRMVYDQKGNLHILVKLWINEKISLRENSRFYINTLGLLGEKYVEISPGTVDQPVIPENSTIVGIDPMSTEELFVKGNEIAGNLGQIMHQLSRLISPQSVDVFMNSLKSITQAMETADAVLRENRVSIRETTSSLKTAAESLPRITAHLEKMSKELDTGLSGKGEKIDTIITNLEDFSRSLEELSALVNQLNADVQAGEGNIGRLVKDEQLYENVSGAAEEMKLLLEDIKENPKKYFKFSVF